MGIALKASLESPKCFKPTVLLQKENTEHFCINCWLSCAARNLTESWDRSLGRLEQPGVIAPCSACNNPTGSLAALKTKYKPVTALDTWDGVETGFDLLSY